MTLDYPTKQRCPSGMWLDEDGGCSLNMGTTPAWMIYLFIGTLWAMAALYAGAGGHAVWRQWRAGVGLDVPFALALLALVTLFATSGALVLRSHLRYGHLTIVYRIDPARGVLERRGERNGRWREEGPVNHAKVREFRLPGGRLITILLSKGKRLPLAALFTPRQREGVQAFARYVNDWVRKSQPSHSPGAHPGSPNVSA